MGRTQETITVSISVSNHNDEQDEIDRAAVERLRERIRVLIEADLVLRGIAWIV